MSDAMFNAGITAIYAFVALRYLNMWEDFRETKYAVCAAVWFACACYWFALFVMAVG